MNYLHNLFMLVFAIALVSIVAYTVAMTAICYNSNDPNSMACFMISNRVEVGFRDR